MLAAKSDSRLLSDLSRAIASARALPRGNVDFGLVGNFQVPPPDALAPFHLASPAERTRRVRDTLIQAWRVYRRGERSMVDSINDAAGTSASGEYAKISLRRILLELNLTAWEKHPNRTRRDVHALFRKAINRLAPHRGGWRVTQERYLK